MLMGVCFFMTTIMAKMMHPCLNANFVDKLGITQSMQEEGKKNQFHWSLCSTCL